MIEQRREQNRKETRECSSKPPPPPPPPKRMLGYVLEVLEKEDEDKVFERERSAKTLTNRFEFSSWCTEEDVKKSKHALCKCLLSNNSMRKHNISGLFSFILFFFGTRREGKQRQGGDFEIDRRNVFTIGDKYNEVGFRSSMRHLARLHCAASSVFPLPESLITTSKCPPREEEEGDDDSKKASTTLGYAAVAFYSNRNAIGEKNRHAITRGEEILNERPVIQNCLNLPCATCSKTWNSSMRSKKTRESETPNFGNDVDRREKGEEKDPEEEEDEGEEDLLPASFGKYPAHRRKASGPLSALGGRKRSFRHDALNRPSTGGIAILFAMKKKEEHRNRRFYSIVAKGV